MGQSMALRRFRRDIGELSRHYWIASLGALELARAMRGLSPNDDPVTALSLTVRFANRLGSTVTELASRMKGDERWRRLGLVVLCNSAFERYVASIALAAIDSDPTLSGTFPLPIDGLYVLKRHLTLAKPEVVGLTKGEWSGRLATYKNLFGSVPPALRAEESALERMRNLRNRVAHHFAEDQLSAISLASAVTLGARQSALMHASRLNVSEPQLLRFMDSLDRAASAIDAHLLPRHVGDFEIASIYLEWDRDRDAFERRIGIQIVGSRRTRELRFRKLIGTLVGRPVGQGYVSELERYVKAL